MTVEQKLAEWLERATPEPPRLVSVDDLRPRSRNRAWLPVLAAACVVLIVLVTLAVAHRKTGNHSVPAITTPPTPTQTTGSASPSPTTSSSVTTSTSPAALTIPPRLWHPKVLNPSFGGGLVADSGVLYAATHDGLVAADESGRVLATQVIPPTSDRTGLGISSQLATSNGELWLASATMRQIKTGAVTIAAFAERTLQPQSSFIVTTLGGRPDALSLVNAPKGQLLLSAGQSVVWIDPARSREIRRLHIQGGTVYGAAESGVTGHLYVDVTNPSDQLVSQLRVLDPQTGAVLDSVTEGATSLDAISDGGVWLYVGGGHYGAIDYLPFGDLTHAVVVDESGGGSPPSVSIIGNTAWLGGWMTLSCSNAATGKPRSSMSIGTEFRSIVDIARTEGHTFAVYSDDKTGGPSLVELQPPKACTR